MKIERELKDCDYYVVMKNPDTHYIEFEVYEVEGWGYPSGKPLFHKKDSPSSSDDVETIEESEVFLHGSIKWDGCSNMHFDQQDRVMLHFCGINHAKKIGVLMDHLYKMAAELMPEHHDYLLKLETK